MQVTVPWPDLRRALSTDAGLNALVTLEVAGESHLSMFRELQRHPVRRDVLHVDFLLVDPNATVDVDVPVVLEGHAEKVEREQGIVDQIMQVLLVSARPGSIPNQLEIDVTELEIGDQIHVSDLVLPDGVTTDVDPEELVAHATFTRAAIEEEEPAEGEEGEAAEGAEDGDDSGDSESSDDEG
jgi:large subunit ribosomal protein L25